MSEASGRRPVTPVQVRKRDGTRVPFDARRIEAAVARAQEAVGDADPALPREVADLCCLTLAARAGLRPDADGSLPPPPPPGIEDLQDLVEEALIGLGRVPIAKAYILYRDRRARARTALSVHAPTDPRSGAPEVRGAEGRSAWNRSRIAAALVREAELSGELAEEVARRVEARVLRAGLPRVSTGLVRAIVDNELAAMGLADGSPGSGLRRGEPVGLPRPDLRALLRAPRRAPDPEVPEHRPLGGVPEARLGEAVLRRWALEDVVGDAVADAHLAGALDLVGLGRAHLPLVRAVPAELLAGGGPAATLGGGPGGGAPTPFRAALPELLTLLEGVGHGLVVENLHGLLGPVLRQTRSSAPLREALATLGALGRATGRRVDLAAPGGRSGSFVARLVPELATLVAEGVPTPRLFLSRAELQPALDAEPELRDVVEALLARGELIPVWGARDERFAAPGCRRRRREGGLLSCGAAVALNLPRLARRAGPWREDVLYEELVGLLGLALEGLERLHALQSDHPGATPRRARTTHAVVPVGLLEALRILGDGQARPDQGARLLGVLSDAARRLAAERGLAVRLDPLLAGDAPRRLAACDAREPRADQRRLFEDLPSPESERALRYSAGFDLGPWFLPTGSERGAARAAGDDLAVLLSTVPSGALWPLAHPQASARGVLPHLEVWGRFDAHRDELQAGPAGAGAPDPEGDDAAAEPTPDAVAPADAPVPRAGTPAPRKIVPPPLGAGPLFERSL